MIQLIQEKGRPNAWAPWFITGRREWDRTTDHHHVKVMLYH
jgi:hypothetical protein